MNFCFEFFFSPCIAQKAPRCTVIFGTIRREERKMEAPYRLILSINLLLISVSLSLFHLSFWVKGTCLVFVLFLSFFAQQHLTISWSWHRLQCYRDFVVPNVQKMQMSNTYGTKWTEGTSASSLFPLLMSILESLGFLTGLTPESLAPLPLLISLLVQHKALYSCVQMILFCFSVIWLIKVIQTTVILICGEPVIWLVAERCEHKSEFNA